MRIIITGSKSFTDYKLLSDTLDRITIKLDKVVVLTNHTKGACKLAHRWAFENMYPQTRYQPDEEEQLLVAGKALICFGKDESGLVIKAKKKGIKVKLF